MTHNWIWRFVVSLPLFTLWGIGLLGCACPKTPGPMVTDQPNETTAPYMVPPYYPQIELGWSRADNNGNQRSRTDAAPGALVRLGLISDLELRLGYDGYAWQRNYHNGMISDLRGWSDVNVGLKYRFFQGSKWLPESAFMGQMSVPVGKEEF